MMRKRRAWNVQLAADLADYHAVRMRGKKKLHDAQPWLGSHRGEHIGVPDDLFRIGLLAGHISIIVEL